MDDAVRALLVGLGDGALVPAPSAKTIASPSLVAVSVPPPMVATAALPLPASIALPMSAARMSPGRMVGQHAGQLGSRLRASSAFERSPAANAASLGHQHGIGPGPQAWRRARPPSRRRQASVRPRPSASVSSPAAFSRIRTGRGGVQPCLTRLQTGQGQRCQASKESGRWLIIPSLCKRGAALRRFNAASASTPRSDQGVDHRGDQLRRRVGAVDVAVIVTVPSSGVS